MSTWLGRDEQLGLMFRYWTAGDQDDSFGFDPTLFPTVSRPFIDTSGTPALQTVVIRAPGVSTGDMTVQTSSSVEGLDLTLKRRLYQDRFSRVDWLYGYQHVSIEEGMNISSNTRSLTAPLGSISITDDFQTQNDFHGISYGVMSTRRFANWKWEGLIRLGAGNLRRRVNLTGSTTTTSTAGASSTDSQGLLVRNTNNHPFDDDTFVVIPEVGLNAAWTIRPGFDFNIGYNYMMIPKVAQASHQVNDNLRVNLSDPLVGALDPEFKLETGQFWLHSLGFGFQLRY